MHLSPRELDKLVLAGAGFVAQKRYARGLLLNYPESVALIASQLLEWIREGESVAALMDRGKKILGLQDVMPGVADLVLEVQVEGTFPDGTKLVTVHQPICDEQGDPKLALYGSGLTREVDSGSKSTVAGGSHKTSAEISKSSLSGAIEANSKSTSTDSSGASANFVPGEVQTTDGSIEINAGREHITLKVTNRGDRPVQVGSHYPFFEVNPELAFHREKAYGFRLNIPSGTAVRFEPGDTKTVELVKITGNEIVQGGNGLTRGALSEANKRKALQTAREQGFRMEEHSHG